MAMTVFVVPCHGAWGRVKGYNKILLIQRTEKLNKWEKHPNDHAFDSDYYIGFICNASPILRLLLRVH